MEYTISHPQSAQWFPEGDYRLSFTLILEKGIVGRWEIETRDGQLVVGRVKEAYKAPYIQNPASIFAGPSIPQMLTTTLRYDSQKSPFIYNIKSLRLYSDSNGKAKPEYIITRPDLTSTTIKTLICPGQGLPYEYYAEHTSCDMNRPKPSFLSP